MYTVYTVYTAVRVYTVYTAVPEMEQNVTGGNKQLAGRWDLADVWPLCVAHAKPDIVIAG